MLFLQYCLYKIVLFWKHLVFKPLYCIFYVTQIIKRYESGFGARNFRVTLGKVDFIAIDAQTLDGKD